MKMGHWIYFIYKWSESRKEKRARLAPDSSATVLDFLCGSSYVWKETITPPYLFYSYCIENLFLAGSCYSPVLQHRTGKTQIPPIPSPDSAIHSCYSPTQSPVTSRHLPSSGFSSPFTPSLSRNNSDASQYGGSQHSSCYSQR